MRGTPPGIEIETLEQIQARYKGREQHLRKAYLLAIWKSMPNNDSDDQQINPENKKELEKIYHEFLKLITTPATSNLLDQFLGAWHEYLSHPWEKPLLTSEGYAWTLAMASAALELPDFVEEGSKDLGDHFRNVLKVVTLEAVGEENWRPFHYMIFDTARRGAVLVFNKRRDKKKVEGGGKEGEKEGEKEGQKSGD
jgi:hypothetical protein